MKRLLIILLVTCCSPIYAQEFAPIGAQWYYSEQAGGKAPENSEYIHYHVVKDTLVAGQHVRKITRTYYQYFGDTVTLEPIFVYQDGQTVYQYNPDKRSFGRLYIFGAQVGDILTLDVPYGDYATSTKRKTYRLQIDSVATETYTGIELKKYKAHGLDGIQFWNDGWFMERLGGLDWFFPRAALNLHPGGPLRCYRDKDLNLKINTIACDYHLNGGDDRYDYQGFAIYPNPSSGEISIKSLRPIKGVIIYNNLGIAVVQRSEPLIDISGYPDGLYIVKVTFDNDRIIYRKILKRRHP